MATAVIEGCWRTTATILLVRLPQFRQKALHQGGYIQSNLVITRMRTTTTESPISSIPLTSPPPRAGSDGWNRNSNHPEGNRNDHNTAASASTLPNRKRRWTRSERRERGEERRQLLHTSSSGQAAAAAYSGTSSTRRQNYVVATAERSFTEQLLACAEKVRRTDSIVVFHATQSRENDRYHQPTTERNVRIITHCDMPPHNNNMHGNDRLNRNNHHYPFDTTSTSSTTTIHVKPLLVLDLNGILCHRIRAHREPAPGLWPYRLAAGHIAATPVIPRTDVVDFCSFLQQHFTLAVWTSAQRKTALQLVELLFPPHVQQRLLFVWAQAQCDRVVPPPPPPVNPSSSYSSSSSYSYYQPSSIPPPPLPSSSSKPDPSQVLYLKDLSKVWREFPLWNASNTLLMDDSPDKCPFFRQNALHPPPIHGQQRIAAPPPPPPNHYLQHHRHDDDDDNNRYRRGSGVNVNPYNHYGNNNNSHNDFLMSDEENQARQFDFFHRLVQFWRDYPISQVVWERDSQPPDPTIRNESLLRFLDDYGVGHMGWMIQPHQ